MYHKRITSIEKEPILCKIESTLKYVDEQIQHYELESDNDLEELEILNKQIAALKIKLEESEDRERLLQQQLHGLQEENRELLQSS
jgi:chromosome segregation ATPase